MGGFLSFAIPLPREITAFATHPRIAAGDALNNSFQKALSPKIKAASHLHNISHHRPQITVSKSPPLPRSLSLGFKQFPLLQARNVTSPRASSENQPHPTFWLWSQTSLPRPPPLATSQPPNQPRSTRRFLAQHSAPNVKQCNQTQQRGAKSLAKADKC